MGDNIEKQKKMSFSVADYVILAIVPSELLIGRLWALVPSTDLMNGIFVILLFGVGFCLSIYLKKDVLKHDYRNFGNHKGKNILSVFIGVILVSLVLLGGRSVLEGIVPTADIGYSTLRVASIITPLFAPFTEEIVFRHVLFDKFKYDKKIYGMMFVISSALFAIAHYENFANNLILALPLFFAGMIFAYFYKKTKNIWVNIWIHFIYDFLFGVLPAIVVLIVGQ